MSILIRRPIIKCRVGPVLNITVQESNGGGDGVDEDLSTYDDAGTLDGTETLFGNQIGDPVELTVNQIATLTQNNQVIQKTGNTTLALSDMEPRVRVVRMTVATANTLTVPKDIFPVGQWIPVYWDDAQTTIVAATDVTITPTSGGLTLPETDTIYWLYQGATNDWILLNGSVSEIIPFVESSGTAVKFDSPRKYGTIASPRTGNITLDSTDFTTNVTQLMVHNHSGSPTFGSEFTIISGSYTTSVNNFILMLSIESGEVLVTISQE